MTNVEQTQERRSISPYSKRELEVARTRSVQGLLMRVCMVLEMAIAEERNALFKEESDLTELVTADHSAMLSLIHANTRPTLEQLTQAVEEIHTWAVERNQVDTSLDRREQDLITGFPDLRQKLVDSYEHMGEGIALPDLEKVKGLMQIDEDETPALIEIVEAVEEPTEQLIKNLPIAPQEPVEKDKNAKLGWAENRIDFPQTDEEIVAEIAQNLAFLDRFIADALFKVEFDIKDVDLWLLIPDLKEKGFIEEMKLGKIVVPKSRRATYGLWYTKKQVVQLMSLYEFIMKGQGTNLTPQELIKTLKRFDELFSKGNKKFMKN